MSNTPILMIGLDATEVTLIERLCRQGKLPAIQSLREQGCFGSLSTDASIFAGGVWSTFYTAAKVPWHGIYHNKLWRYQNMRCEVANEQWLPAQPFWDSLDQQNYRLGIIDVPMTVGTPRLRNGVQLAGWGTHDLISTGAWPPHLWKQLKQIYGPPQMLAELFGPQSAKTLLRLRESLLSATEQLANISTALFTQEKWDLFLVVFGATHRAGHYLWDLSQIDTTGLPDSTRHMLDNALVEIYQACDRAVARLVEQAPPEARILVFAIHGMGQNSGWSDYCTEILAKIQQGQTGDVPKKGLLYQLKKAIPWQLTQQITTRLPQPVLNRLVALWSADMFDWSTTRYFPVPMDQAGYIKINLKGREPQGIVHPGPEYHTLCQEIEAAFQSFVDIETGRPIVNMVYKMDDLAPPDAPYRNLLPDLVITWHNVSAIQSVGIKSEKYGEIRLNSEGKLPSGRAGNHQDKGWFVVRGNGIQPGTHVDGHHIIDLAPTVFRWLGAEPPTTFQGQPIPALCASQAAYKHKPTNWGTSMKSTEK